MRLVAPAYRFVPHTEQKSDRTRMAEVDPELKTDARWQLIERITSSPSFQKSARIRDLLRYMAERTLHGHTQDLTEHRIGSAVFGKPQDYSVVDDSSVRVHVRQLRLKLHEYFDGEGREEACVVEIPKGAYTTLFRSVGQRTTAPAPAATGQTKSWLQWLPWGLAALFLVTTLTAWFYHPAVAAPPPPPWPLVALFTPPNRPVQVVVADVNYGMTRLVDEQPVTLERYLSPSYRSGADLTNAHPTKREARMMRYLSGSLLTSYADLVVVSTLLRVSGSARDWLAIRSARELRPRDLEEGSSSLSAARAPTRGFPIFPTNSIFRNAKGWSAPALNSSRISIPNPANRRNTRGSISPAARVKTTRPFHCFPCPAAEAAF